MPSLTDYTPLIKRFDKIFRQTPDLVIEDDPKNSNHTVIKVSKVAFLHFSNFL